MRQVLRLSSEELLLSAAFCFFPERMRASAEAEPQRSPKGAAFCGAAEADALIRSGAAGTVLIRSGVVTLSFVFSVFFPFTKKFSLDVRL